MLDETFDLAALMLAWYELLLEAALIAPIRAIKLDDEFEKLAYAIARAPSTLLEEVLRFREEAAYWL
jgi:hypothetical protein